MSLHEDNESIVVVATNITERKQAEEALQESEERYRTLADNSAVGIWQITPDGHTLYLNPAMCAMLEIDAPEELADKTFHSFFSLESLETMKREHAKRPRGISSTYEAEIVGERGRRRNVVICGGPILRPDGEFQSMIATFIDITERKQAEERLLEYQLQLRSLASELSLIEDRERRRIATDLHDRIGQGLAVSKTKLKALRGKLSAAGPVGMVDEILEVVEQATEDTRTLIFELSPPMLYELGLEPALEWLLGRLREQHGLDCKLDDDGQPKPLGEDSRALLFRATLEILMNVVKHAKARSVSVSIRKRGDDIEVTIEDDGAGLDTAKLGDRVQETRTFGLFSVRERLRHLGGSFNIESERGRGTRVTLSAPLEKKTNHTVGNASEGKTSSTDDHTRQTQRSGAQNR